MTAKDFKPKAINQQTIVITGASSGIGLATAEMAAKRGANVVLSSRNENELIEICKKLTAAGYKAIGVKADVKNKEDLENLRSQAERAFGKIDTWVNNAGGSIYGPLLEIPEFEERELFETNFWGTRHGCHVAVDAFKGHGGVIINVGSEVSARAIPLQGMYSATKHAVKAYTDALRMELDKDEVPIKVCLVRPTAIDTLFPEHAVNHLKSGEPSLPDPCYHPDYAAEKILKCAENPERDVYVGAQSKLSAIMEFLAPGLTDKYMLKKLFDDQIKGTRTPHRIENEALFTPSALEGELRGHHKGKIKADKEMLKPHITDLN
ncbi:SDR family oxidoreductase [Bdellovibrio reynosensis]|uniref:SDR family oxidoreductase n=1 Tax=Bdellovibrio reynosensis TaxID=2835041 RepID=A0ABY4C6D8_9BACT|nr:SDR family oxidoreductase [Bdellovibrio reynosensis]UOF00531.1 SDR family oxidoreductase [Bdellovibrio reynosensis]